MGASTVSFPGFSDPTMLEAVVCREALALVEDLGQRTICVASSCLQVINNLERPFLGT